MISNTGYNTRTLVSIKVHCYIFFFNNLENINNVLAEAGLTTANIVKTTVFLADMSLFAEMNAVYAKYFEGDFPARSAVAVKALPKGALVEIESIAVR